MNADSVEASPNNAEDEDPAKEIRRVYGEVLEAAPEIFCRWVCGVLLDAPEPDNVLNQLWAKDDSRFPRLVHDRKRYAYLADLVMAKLKGDRVVTGEEWVSLADLAREQAVSMLEIKYLSVRFPDLDVLDFHSIVWTLFESFREALDSALSTITDWVTQGTPIYIRNEEGLELLHSDHPKIIFLEESAKLGGLYPVYRPPEWMNSLFARRSHLKIREWLFNFEHTPSDEELVERRRAFRKQIDLPVNTFKEGQSQRIAELAVLGTAVKPICELWPLVASMLGVARQQAAVIVEEQLLEMEAVVYLDDEVTGLWTARGHSDKLISDLSNSEFAKGEEEDSGGWEKFRVTPADFDFVLEAVSRIHTRQPPQVRRFLPSKTISLTSSQLVPLSELGARIAASSGADFPSAFDRLWQALCQRTTIEAYDIAGELPNCLGEAGWIVNIADHCAMNNPEADLKVLQRYGLLPDDARTMEGMLGARPAALATRPGYLDPENPRYAPKLAAAIAAWEAVTDPGIRTPRQALEAWLKENGTPYGLLDEKGKTNATAIEQCSAVANWNMKGGAPRTPG